MAEEGGGHAVSSGPNILEKREEGVRPGSTEARALREKREIEKIGAEKTVTEPVAWA